MALRRTPGNRPLRWSVNTGRTFGGRSPSTRTGLLRLLLTALGLSGPCSGRKTCCFQCATVRGSEIRYLPLAAIRVFFQIIQLWELSGCLPLQLARQITLCKPGKMEPKSHLQVKYTKPITVMSCFWRVHASSWTRNAQLCAWVKAHLHASVAYGKGMRHTIV